MFFLITPIHNEINEIDGLIHCVNSSIEKPDLWVIVDDNSNDGSSEKLDEVLNVYNYIYVIHLNEQASYMEFHISEVFCRGVQVIENKIKNEDYIGFLDADIRFGKKYWYQLRQALEKNNKLANTCCNYCYCNSIFRYFTFG